jgi:hypothetical protein
MPMHNTWIARLGFGTLALIAAAGCTTKATVGFVPASMRAAPLAPSNTRAGLTSAGAHCPAGSGAGLCTYQSADSQTNCAASFDQSGALSSISCTVEGGLSWNCNVAGQDFVCVWSDDPSCADVFSRSGMFVGYLCGSAVPGSDAGVACGCSTGPCALNANRCADEDAGVGNPDVNVSAVCQGLDEVSCLAENGCRADYCDQCGQRVYAGCSNAGSGNFACSGQSCDAGPADCRLFTTEAACAAQQGCRLDYCDQCGQRVFTGCANPTDPQGCASHICLDAGVGIDATSAPDATPAADAMPAPDAMPGQDAAVVSCHGLDANACTAAGASCRPDYCPGCGPNAQSFSFCSDPMDPPWDCQPPLCASCAGLDQASCEGSSLCHAVYTQANNCNCEPVGLNGCCTQFTGCADGPATCTIRDPGCATPPPACVGSYVIGWNNMGCAEGCVAISECPSSVTCGGTFYPPGFPIFDRTCTSPADCVVARHQIDCCGSFEATGIRSSEMTRFQGDEQLCESQSPACACASRPTVADDGTSAQTATAAPNLACVNFVCTTSFH